MKRNSKGIILILLFFCLLVFQGLDWAFRNFDISSFEQLLFHLKVPLSGMNNNIVLDFTIEVILFALFITIIMNIIIDNFFSYKGKFEISVKIFKLEKNFKITLFKHFNTILTILLSLFSLYCVYHIYNKFGIDEWIKSRSETSLFIEENYVSPDDTSIEFPAKKRNLIHIYVESLENTFMTKENGGANSLNVIPNFTMIAKDNVSFSNYNMGGAYTYNGSGWTIAALVSQTSGLPLKMPIDTNTTIKHFSVFLPGVETIGDILENNGYKNVFLIGSDKSFGGRDIYFESHGNYEIIDYNKLKEENFVPDDYNVWWGIEDKKIIEYAKAKLTELSTSSEPFNFTLLTADTHFVGGYLDETCDATFNNQFDNVLYCSDRLIYKFINWIQDQSFYDNTTIVITGDHLSMDGDYISRFDENYDRTVYNAFINSLVEPTSINNRVFTTFDIFPTTLASLGVKIEGNRLGLGTNLFSDVKTLAEEYSNMNNELYKRSEFYEKLVYPNN